ncbi:MAG: DNA-binding domain-containing protein [Pseudomonadota bacterium]|nr:DNA-binding domain-containing protein [Pseudomonadota bacterium]
MSGLADLQREFQRYLLHRPNHMTAAVAQTPRLSAAERLDVYDDAYRTRLREALQTDFPALHTLLGDGGFRAMAGRYIAAHPSRHYSIRWFGARLSGFLATDAAGVQHPVLAEMAAFEWALSAALDAADAPVAVPADLAAVAPQDWPGLRFAFHPSVQRLDLLWNVPQLWHAVKDQAPPQPPQRQDATQPWLVWRKGIRCYFYSLPAAHAWMLDAALAGDCFADLCAGLCQWESEDQVAAHAARRLREWLDHGLIAAVRTGP